MLKAQVNDVTIDIDIVRVSVPNVPDRPGIAYRLFSSLIDANIHIEVAPILLRHNIGCGFGGAK